MIKWINNMTLEASRIQSKKTSLGISRNEAIAFQIEVLSNGNFVRDGQIFNFEERNGQPIWLIEELSAFMAPSIEIKAMKDVYVYTVGNWTIEFMLASKKVSQGFIVMLTNGKRKLTFEANPFAKHQLLELVETQFGEYTKLNRNIIIGETETIALKRAALRCLFEVVEMSSFRQHMNPAKKAMLRIHYPEAFKQTIASIETEETLVKFTEELTLKQPKRLHKEAVWETRVKYKNFKYRLLKGNQKQEEISVPVKYPKFRSSFAFTVTANSLSALSWMTEYNLNSLPKKQSLKLLKLEAKTKETYKGTIVAKYGNAVWEALENLDHNVLNNVVSESVKTEILGYENGVRVKRAQE